MSQLNVNTIKNRTGTSGPVLTGLSTVSGSLVVSNDATVSGAATVSGNLSVTGNVSVGGTLTYEDVTNIDSVGIVTARTGVRVTAGGLVVTAGVSTFAADASIADKIVHTGDTNTAIRFPAADTFTVETAGSERLRVDSSGRIIKGLTTARGNFGNNASGVDIETQIEGTSFTSSALSIIRNSNDANDGGIVLGKTRATSTGGSTVVQAGDDLGDITFAGSDGTSLQHGANIVAEVQSGVGNDDMPTDLIFKTNSGTTSTTERLRITSTGGVHFNNAELIERVKITAGKLSDNTNIDLDDGMVHYFTTTETSAAVPNITSSVGINTSMATGDTMSVTIVTTAAAAAFAGTFAIDHKQVGVTTFFSGGAPTEGGSSGKDVTALTIVKTGDAAFDVLASVTNFE
tara:strand:- start:339 stop:1544 length:1206 start_codon:yes stop_codon:yes gene_type:complete